MNNWGLIIELASVAVGLTCVFLAGRGRVLNFWFGYLYVALLTILFASKHLYFSMALQPICLVINIVGHYRWTHPKKGEENSQNELKITHISHPIIARYAIFTILLGLLLGWCMQQSSALWPDAFIPATRPYIDASVVTLTLLAQYLSAQKYLECWWVWLVVNTTNIILYLLAGMVFMPCVSACYLVLAIIGLVSWSKTMKEQ